MREFSKRNELHYVSRHFSLISLTVKRRLVSIKLVHSRKVSTADSHDNNAERQTATPNNLVDSLLKIVDDAVCNYQQDIILLVLLRHTHAFCHVINQLKNRREVRRAIKTDLVNCIFVGFDDALDTITLWIEYIAVQRKAVVCCLIERRNRSTETKRRDFFIRIIILQNTTHTLDCVVVFVLFDITNVVEGVRLAWLDIRQSKVNRNRKSDLASSEDEVKE